MKYRAFIKILEEHRFVCIRQKSTHRHYEGFVKGERRLVTADFNHAGEDIMRHNLASMIRQSGLPKKLFR